MFFNKLLQKSKPENREVYAVLGGTYGGEFFVFIKEQGDNYVFLSLPDKVLRTVPVEAYSRGIKNKILDYIDKLPKAVYRVVEEEYKKLNNIHGNSTTKADAKSNKRANNNT